MADAYWRYTDSRQQQQQQQQQPTLPPLVGKRPRSDYDVSGGHELGGYFARDVERAAYPVLRDTDSLGASYDRYLRNAQIASYGGGDSARPITGGLSGHSVDDARMIGVGGSDPAVALKSHSMGLEGGMHERPLPPGATNTLFVEGLPANCTSREVSHIFRPFVGYKEVRLVSKESRRPDGEPLVLCFVDFVSPAHAATAMEALQVSIHTHAHRARSVRDSHSGRERERRLDARTRERERWLDVTVCGGGKGVCGGPAKFSRSAWERNGCTAAAAAAAACGSLEGERC